MHQEKDIADNMAVLNTATFNSLDIEAIIFTASSCGLTLKEYERKPFTHPLYDITEFLQLYWPDTIKLKASAATAKKSSYTNHAANGTNPRQREIGIKMFTPYLKKYLTLP